MKERKMYNNDPVEDEWDGYNAELVQQLLDDSPLLWGHPVRVLEKVKDADQRVWYVRTAPEHGGAV